MLKITEITQPKEEEFEVLKLGLNGFNDSFTGSVYRETISAFIKDEAGEIKGGILGEIKWGWLYIQGLWVSEGVRSKGLGSELLKQMEEYALSKGIVNYRLETTSFQALDFYKKQQYEVFAELSDMPPGYTSYFLKKERRI